MALRGAILLRNLSEINYKPPRGLLFSRSFSRTNVHSEEVCSINSNVDRKHYDVIIAGGGLVGAAMACAIGKYILSLSIVQNIYCLCSF